MEGDGPTGALVLANYFQTIKDLKKKEAAGARENAFHPMYHKMITKLEEYQEEALQCETLVMATLLHPAFRLRFIAHCWPQKEKEAQSLLEKHFNKREALLKKSQDDIEELEKDTPKVDNDNIFELFNAPPDSAESKELEAYIKNMDRSTGPAAKDLKSVLIWWKVCHLYFHVVNNLILISVYVCIIGSFKDVSCPIIFG